MKIIGRGFRGIVVADGPGIVKKFYASEHLWQQERAKLAFIFVLRKEGLDIGCRIPGVVSSARCEPQKIEGTTYHFWNRMELIPGVPISRDYQTKSLEALGKNLGTVLYRMHHETRPYTSRWVSRFGTKDELWEHLFAEKADRVLEESSDRKVLRYVTAAAKYLKDREASLRSQRTLSHGDLSTNNILADEQNAIEGLADWDGFGFTHPTISLYQLATTPNLWRHVREQYTELGGAVLDDILYAVAVIHLAWTPLACRERGLRLDEDDVRTGLEHAYGRFVAHRSMTV